MATKRPFWKSTGFLPIVTNMYVQFEIEIPKQTSVTLKKPYCLIRKTKDSIRLPFSQWHHKKNDRLLHLQTVNVLAKFVSGNFESNTAENQKDSADSHKWYARKISSWDSEANSGYVLKTMPLTDSWNRKGQYGHQRGILKTMSLKIDRLLSIYSSMGLLNFGVDIQSQTKVRVWKPKKKQYGRQAAILKVTSLQIDRLLPMTTINMHMKSEIEIPRQTWLTLQRACRI